jgi:hypothetical protein
MVVNGSLMMSIESGETERERKRERKKERKRESRIQNFISLL